MSCDRKHEILDNGFKPSPVVAAVDEVTDRDLIDSEVTDRDLIDSPTEFVDWDLNSDAALNEGLRLGWDHTQLLFMSDEIFGRILTKSLLASEWDIDGDGFDVSRRCPTVVEAPVVEAPVVEVVEVVEVAAPVVVQVVELAAPVVVAPVVLTLLIGCRPAKGMEYRELHDVLEPAMREVENLKRVSYWDLLPYNEGQKLLAASVLMHAPTGVVVVDPAAPYANAVLAVLLPMASVVVRA
jgi:hypothetical protein